MNIIAKKLRDCEPYDVECALGLKAADEIHRLTEALIDVRELVDGREDIDNNGQPNLAMRIMAVVAIALREDQ